MRDRLADKTAVVTGSSSGIGAAIARRFAAEGARVVVNFRASRERAEAVVAAIESEGGAALALQGDVSDEAQVARLVERARDALGRIDVWVNNAGADILTGEGAALGERERLDALLAVDLKGTMLCSWAVAPVMQAAGGGVIINVSWDLIHHGMPGRNPELFAAVKGGVHAFTKSLARSLAPSIRVNDVAPGWIETAFARGEMGEDFYAAVAWSTPLKRFGQPEDVAAAVLYLASDEAAFLTGQTLKVNGGVVP